MSFVCMCMVVAIHLNYDRNLWDGFMFECLFNGFTRAAVPFFFIVSGYLLSEKFATYGGGYVVERKKGFVRWLCRMYVGVSCGLYSWD